MEIWPTEPSFFVVGEIMRQWNLYDALLEPHASMFIGSFALSLETHQFKTSSCGLTLVQWSTTAGRSTASKLCCLLIQTHLIFSKHGWDFNANRDVDIFACILLFNFITQRVDLARRAWSEIKYIAVPDFPPPRRAIQRPVFPSFLHWQIGLMPTPLRILGYSPGRSPHDSRRMIIYLST